MRIGTNYRINDDPNSVDTEIEAYLYEALKLQYFTQNITFETFIDRDNHNWKRIVSSQKVFKNWLTTSRHRHSGLYYYHFAIGLVHLTYVSITLPTVWVLLLL